VSVCSMLRMAGDGKRPGAIRDAGRESIEGLATPRWQNRFRLSFVQNTKV
jgi:hypothetical protein